MKGQASMSESDSEVPERYISPREAREEDIVQRARDTGRSIEQVRQIVLLEDAFNAYRSVLHTQYDDCITGSWVTYEPMMKGYVRFVQEVPSEAIVALETFKILDTNNVILFDDGAISLDNHFRRVELSAKALVDLRYTNTEISYNQVEDQLEIRQLLPEGVTPPNVKDLVAAIQQQLDKNQSTNQETTLQGRAAIIEVYDIELIILRGDGPMIRFDSAQGGT